jgi:anti-sigma regulatory factor (Ser/Thr protein kinase)
MAVARTASGFPPPDVANPAATVVGCSVPGRGSTPAMGWLPPEPSSVVRARHMVRDECADFDARTRLDLELIVSELATNAVRHAGTPFKVRVENDGGSVRIAVDDRSDDQPARVEPDGYRGGRGLRIVDTLASDWGTEPADGGGKRVWARVDLAGQELPAHGR